MNPFLGGVSAPPRGSSGHNKTDAQPGIIALPTRLKTTFSVKIRKLANLLTAKSACKHPWKRVYWLRRGGGIIRVCRQWLLSEFPTYAVRCWYHLTVAAAHFMAFHVMISYGGNDCNRFLNVMLKFFDDYFCPVFLRWYLFEYVLAISIFPKVINLFISKYF